MPGLGSRELQQHGDSGLKAASHWRRDMNPPGQPVAARRISVPRHLFLLCISVGILTPLVARLPGALLRGWEWFTSYVGSVEAFLYFSAFNLVPALVLYGLGKISRRAPLAFTVALIGLVGYLLWTHGGINLRASSTASIGLMFIPIYAVGVVVVAWIVGLLIHSVVKNERGRVWAAGLTAVLVVGLALGNGVYDSYYIAKRESRFPVVSVNKIPLAKKQVFKRGENGAVSDMAIGNFGAVPTPGLLVLSTQGTTVLSLDDYPIRAQIPFTREQCEHCVGMYPTLVADGKGSFFVATSDGVADSRGRLLWANKAEGFSRVVPIDSERNGLAFVAYDRYQEANLRNASGETLWSLKLPVEDVGLYVAADGQRLPFAITRSKEAYQLLAFDFAGQPVRTISLPGWASTVQSIAWPTPGHLLVGQGGWLGIFDAEGKEILRHAISDTSFNPYHGPNGVAAKLCGGNDAFLAVMSHGSSGYARSVLLVFDPQGQLVWQEEVKKSEAMLAVRKDGSREVLLVGGIDGISEYSLPVGQPGDPAIASPCAVH